MAILFVFLFFGRRAALALATLQACHHNSEAQDVLSTILTKDRCKSA